ncbi:potassium channel family protein [Thiomicrorhabdus sp. Kp2]|uniref:potassium channel family protein n=1 Tax=Thiomicrorhabdus sp. Kp2 TaxID=1123518 RepID=UPI00041162D2|nr:potassium channel family protein [Thiomicrorhabdus sp. Kp2]
MRLNALLGVAGVNYLESEKAQKIGRMFEFIVLIALLVVFAQVFMLFSEELIHSHWINSLIWLVFFAELVVNLFFVKNKVRYLKENWLNVAIVLVAFPGFNWGSDWALIVRSLRLLLFVRFFTSFFKDFISILNRNRFGQILVASAFIILGAGALFAFLEDKTFWDGVWYSLVTITTVGYGDIVPVSEYGRIFGVFLILFGVVFFSLVTANISAFLIGSEQRKLERDILDYMKATEKRLANQQLVNDEHVERIIMHMSNEIRSLKTEMKKLQAESITKLRQENLERHKDDH